MQQDNDIIDYDVNFDVTDELFERIQKLEDELFERIQKLESAVKYMLNRLEGANIVSMFDDDYPVF